MKYIESDITVQGAYKLSASIIVPENKEKKYPAVLIVPGTGKLDKDGNMKGLKTNLYKDLAYTFAEKDCVVLRYDKRGTNSSEGKFNETGAYDLLNDMETLVNYLKENPNVDPQKVIVCGHSEGAILANILVDRNIIGGAIMLSGAGMSLKEALYYQNQVACNEVKNLKGPKGTILRRLIKKEKQFKKVDDLFEKCEKSRKDELGMPGMKINAKWVREHANFFTLDMLEILEKTEIPILAITGSKDAQADPDGIARVESLNQKNITCHLIDNMNHGLKNCDGEMSVLNTKKDIQNSIDEPIKEELKEKIYAWLETNFNC